MNKEATHIDITSSLELARLAEEVHASMQPRSLQRDGETIAVVMPVASKKRTKRPPTPEDRAAALSVFGAWDGNVDVDRLKADLEASRHIPPRPAPEL